MLDHLSILKLAEKEQVNVVCQAAQEVYAAKIHKKREAAYFLISQIDALGEIKAEIEKLESEKA